MKNYLKAFMCCSSAICWNIRSVSLKISTKMKTYVQNPKMFILINFTINQNNIKCDHFQTHNPHQIPPSLPEFLNQ